MDTNDKLNDNDILIDTNPNNFQSSLKSNKIDEALEQIKSNVKANTTNLLFEKIILNGVKVPIITYLVHTANYKVIEALSKVKGFNPNETEFLQKKFVRDSLSIAPMTPLMHAAEVYYRKSHIEELKPLQNYFEACDRTLELMMGFRDVVQDLRDDYFGTALTMAIENCNLRFVLIFLKKCKSSKIMDLTSGENSEYSNSNPIALAKSYYLKYKDDKLINTVKSHIVPEKFKHILQFLDLYKTNKVDAYNDLCNRYLKGDSSAQTQVLKELNDEWEKTSESENKRRSRGKFEGELNNDEYDENNFNDENINNDENVERKTRKTAEKDTKRDKKKDEKTERDKKKEKEQKEKEQKEKEQREKEQREKEQREKEDKEKDQKEKSLEQKEGGNSIEGKKDEIENETENKNPEVAPKDIVVDENDDKEDEDMTDFEFNTTSAKKVYNGDDGEHVEEDYEEGEGENDKDSSDEDSDRDNEFSFNFGKEPKKIKSGFNFKEPVNSFSGGLSFKFYN